MSTLSDEEAYRMDVEVGGLPFSSFENWKRGIVALSEPRTPTQPRPTIDSDAELARFARELGLTQRDIDQAHGLGLLETPVAQSEVRQAARPSGGVDLIMVELQAMGLSMEDYEAARKAGAL